MSIYGAMFAGVSGLSAQSNALGMISDNIANVNTVGYKATQARFSTLVTTAATQSAYNPGGVMSSPYSFVDQQGLLQGSTSKTDVAIAGQGFFVVHEDSSPSLGSNYLFTRAGQFNPDENGDLVNAAGFFLQGYNIADGSAPPPSSSTFSGLETVNIANLSGSASPTENLTLGLNLPSTAGVGDAFSVTVQIFDSLGNAHDMALTFNKTAVNDWSFSVADPTLNGSTSGTAAGAGTVTFNGDGTPATITIGTPLTVTGWTTGADNSAITLDLGTVGQTNGLTQFAGSYEISVINQDGVRFGVYSGISIDEDGIVTALFDNGRQQDIYQLPLATFRNANGLEELTGNAYQQTNTSGNFQLNLARNGGAGVFAPSSLEASTVDLAEEFTNMIIVQRAYSANSKVITTADQMLDELVRIKR